MDRKTLNRQNTIASIKEAFLDVYDEMGLDKLSVRKVCESSSVGKSTFYLYFQDKYDVLEQIEADLERAFLAIGDTFPEGDFERMLNGEPSELVLGYFKAVRNNARAVRALLGVNGDPRFAYVWQRYLVNLFKSKARDLEVDSCKASIGAPLFAASATELTRHFLREMANMSDEECALVEGRLFRFFLLEL